MAAILALMLLPALSACNLAQPVIMNPSEIRILGARVVAVLDVAVLELDLCGSALAESPLAGVPDRAATGKVESVLAGDWPRSREVEIRFDKAKMIMTSGRYFVMADA